MGDADFLDGLLLRVVQLIHIAVFPPVVEILLEVCLQIRRGGHLASGLADTGYHQIAQHVIRYGIKANSIIDLIQNELGAVYHRGL